MTYNVFGGTFNLAQLQLLWLRVRLFFLDQSSMFASSSNLVSTFIDKMMRYVSYVGIFARQVSWSDSH